MQGSFDDLFDDLPMSGRMRSIRRDLLDRPIATVMDAEQASQYYLAFMRGEIDEATLDQGLEDCIVEHGMSKAEIEAEFPPQPLFPGQSHLSFNRTALIATILWQEWQRVGQRRPKGNIRHFWYTHLMYTLTRVMKDTNIASIETCYNNVLKSLVKTEGFRYADLNFVSIKSKLCEAIFADSPYPNIILACEKESYHTHLKHLAHLFHVTYISLGGQPSYGAFEDLVFQFMENGINLDQEFRILVVTDFDPQGYKIQDAAKDHLERAGIRQVAIERVYLNPEHITPGIIERFAVPFEVKKGKDSTTKAQCTLYNGFGVRTGGIYKRNGELVPCRSNGNGTYHVPQLTTGDEGYELYRVELDNFREDVLIQLLIDALERVIDGADYYYTAAKMLWRRTVSNRVVEAAITLIQCAVREKLRPVSLALSDLRGRLSTRWDELTDEEDTLIRHVLEDRTFQVESLQEDIDNLQERIDAMREEQSRLSRQQWAIRETTDDVVAFLRAVKRAMVPTIPEAQQLLLPADAQLRAYGEAQEESQADSTANRFTVMPADIRDVIDCSPYARTVFERARAGDETFRAELNYREQQRVISAATDDLESQQAAMTVEVPDLPAETVEEIEQRMRNAESLLAQADRTGALSDAWQTLRTHLVDHYLHDDQDWDPWNDWEDGAWQG